jgi:hypothetical protein
MKTQQFILVFIFLVVISCHSASDDKAITTELISSPLTADQSAEKVLTPKIQMIEESFDFGEIQQGESVTHDFVLKNIGDAKLVISTAKGSCGCTVPEWPKEPIAKAEEGIITVTFNSAGRSGKQNKKVTLVTNAIPNTKVITLTGNVIVPEKK